MHSPLREIGETEGRPEISRGTTLLQHHRSFALSFDTYRNTEVLGLQGENIPRIRALDSLGP
jgi:hypothetical protein